MMPRGVFLPLLFPLVSEGPFPGELGSTVAVEQQHLLATWMSGNRGAKSPSPLQLSASDRSFHIVPSGTGLHGENGLSLLLLPPASSVLPARRSRCLARAKKQAGAVVEGKRSLRPPLCLRGAGSFDAPVPPPCLPACLPGSTGQETPMPGSRQWPSTTGAFPQPQPSWTAGPRRARPPRPVPGGGLAMLSPGPAGAIGGPRGSWRPRSPQPPRIGSRPAGTPCMRLRLMVCSMRSESRMLGPLP